MCSVPLPSGRTTMRTRNWGISVARSWSGARIQTPSASRGRDGSTTARLWAARYDCTFWQRPSQRVSSRESVSTRWDSCSLTCAERDWTDYACTSKLGRSQTSTRNSFLPPTCQCLASRKTATSQCSKLASMLSSTTKKRKSSCLCLRHSKETAYPQSNQSAKTSKSKPNKQSGPVVTEASMRSRAWSIVKLENTSSSGRVCSSAPTLWSIRTLSRWSSSGFSLAWRTPSTYGRKVKATKRSRCKTWLWWRCKKKAAILLQQSILLIKKSRLKKQKLTDVRDLPSTEEQRLCKSATWSNTWTSGLKSITVTRTKRTDPSSF